MVEITIDLTIALVHSVHVAPAVHDAAVGHHPVGAGAVPGELEVEGGGVVTGLLIVSLHVSGFQSLVFKSGQRPHHVVNH